MALLPRPFPLPAMRWRRLLTWLPLLLAGCVSYDYVPPTTDAGRQCVATCEVATQTCAAGARQANATNNSSSQIARSTALAACLGTARNDHDRKKCRERNGDWGGGGGFGGGGDGFSFHRSWNFGSGGGGDFGPMGGMGDGGGDCQPAYDRCFQTCGGQIIERRQ